MSLSASFYRKLEYDEYQASVTDHDHQIDFPHSDDAGVQNSVMNSQWNACGATPNLNWLNFSIERHNTQRNAQHRMYEASGWQTLARLPSEDPRVRSATARTSRPYYLELSKVAPQGNQDASIELPSQQTEARARLDVYWVNLGTTHSSLKRQETAFPAYIDSVSGDVVEFPKPVILVARVGETNPIAKAEVETSVQSPDGRTVSLALQDNGLAPDIRANDGLYSGFMPYNQGGVYTVTVTFSNNSGNAVFTANSFSCQHVIRPNGETCILTTKPVGQNFSSRAKIGITVSNYQHDDHGNSPQDATLLADNNVDVAGGINVGSDIDVFRVLPSFTGRLSIRVTDLAFGMQPKIRILQADGTTVSDEFEFAPTSEDYFVTTIDVQIYQPFYVSMAHQDAGASTGLYKISVGKPLAGEDMAVYLPLISR